MTFGFSIYAVPLQVTPVAYFRSEIRDLGHGRLLEDSEMCYY